MTVDAISFDCFGTLIDREAGIRSYVGPLLARSHWRGVTLETWSATWAPIHARLLSEPWRPYRQVMTASYEATMRALGLEVFADAGPGLARAVSAWQPFPDVVASLRRLATRARLAVVTNIDVDLLADTVGHLRAPLACLVTAEEAGAFKPSPKPFELLLERLGLPAQSVLHVASSIDDDLVPASRLGMQTALLRRNGATAHYEREVDSLAELATLL